MQGGSDGSTTAPGLHGLNAGDWLRAATIPVWLGSIFVAANATWSYVTHDLVGLDAHAYWLTASRDQLYGAPPQSIDAFLYSPAFAQLIWPLAQLPWPLFVSLWMIAEAATFAWLLWPIGWRWGVPAFCWCVPEIMVGNVYAFLAVVAVLGMRRPFLWAFPILTKVTPGLGILWFAVRREWRNLAWAVGGTLALTGLSLLINPTLWSDWVSFLVSNAGASGGVELQVRLLAAVILTVVCARLDKGWLLPVAMLAASPVIAGVSAASLLAAIPRLRQAQVSRHIPVPPLPEPDAEERGYETEQSGQLLQHTVGRRLGPFAKRRGGDRLRVLPLSTLRNIRCGTLVWWTNARR